MAGSPSALHGLAARLRLLAEEMDGCAHRLRTGAAGAEEALRRQMRQRVRDAPIAADRLRHASAAAQAYAYRLEAVLAHRVRLARFAAGQAGAVRR
ncbi:hypothetical protein ACIQGZ_00450 [Streptomyces sp. NPDC092296]|uniref:hypothetical protein n=1 Tax=Streptomyces sp. NPDC092296 TaxID=3366012 RepID=UPI0037FBEF5F